MMYTTSGLLGGCLTDRLGYRGIFANLSLRTKGLVAVSLPLAALLGTGLTSYFAFQQNQVAAGAVRRSLELSNQIQLTLTLLVDAETGVRGYVLSEAAEFLDPYHQARLRLPVAVGTLESLVRDNGEPGKRAGRVRRLVAQRLEVLEETKSRARWLSPLAAKGKTIMDLLRVELAGMEAEEARVLKERTQRAERLEQWTRIAIVGGVGLGAVGGLVTVLVIAGGLAGRLRRLEVQARRLAQGFPLTLELSGRDEIGRLEQAMVTAAGLLAERQTALEAEVAVRREAEASLEEKARLTALVADVALALTQADDLPATLQKCAQAFVDQLDAAFARLWTLNAGDNVLELQASAGMYTHLDGPHSRVPVGRYKIGLIAQERKPHLTNAVTGDPRVGDQEWARREGMVAFAGYPLMVENRVVGVLGVFAKHALSQGIMEELEPVAYGIALYIERVRNQEELHKAKQEAEQANLAKSEFISRMSHELRTPLNAILGFAQILEIEQPTASQRESLQQILRAGRHLLDLINELIDISRIESGKLACSLEPVAVNAALQDVCELVQPSARRYDVEVIWEKSGSDHRHISADRQRLKQVLLNLLTNGVKYSGAGSRVVVSTSQVDGRLSIQVRDTGPGIAGEKIPRLFNLFDRLGAERSDVEGTGMGLVLAKGLTELMGGRIGVESRVGEGSTFWVEFDVVPSPVDRVHPDGGEEAAGGFAPRAGHTLLYIEDNLSNMQLMERILQHRQEVRLVTASRGREGLQLAQTQRPDIILLDVHLPDIGGEQVLRELRNDPATSSIPVIILSADATPGQIQRLLEGGARSYLTKPLDVAALLSILDKTLAR